MADKPTVQTVTALAQNIAFQVNKATDQLADAFIPLFSKDGSDSMEGPLDMNGNKITGVAPPTSGTDAVRLVDLSDSDATGAASAQLRADLLNPNSGYGADLVGDTVRASELSSTGTGEGIDLVGDGIRKSHLSVESISALKAIAFTPTEGQNITALGYYTKGDGGGGQFYWDATSTESDNGGTIIKATAITTGRWKRIYNDIIYVDWFGAKGDGTTDDYAAINAAQQVADILWLTEGKTYIIDSKVTLVDGVKWRGGGTIKAGPSVRDTLDMLRGDKISVDFADITIDGDSQLTTVHNAGMGLLLYSPPTAIIRNVTFQDCGKDGLYFGGGNTGGDQGATERALVTDCYFYRNHRSGIAAVDYIDLEISNNFIYDTYSAGIDIEINDDAGLFNSQGERCIITGNIIAQYDQTIKSQTDYQRVDLTNSAVAGGEESVMVFSNNIIDDYWETVDDTRTTSMNILGITTENIKLTATGNIIRTNAVTTATDGIVKLSGVAHVNMENNIIEHYGTETASGQVYAHPCAIKIQEAVNNDIKLNNEILGLFNRGIWAVNASDIDINGKINLSTAMQACVFLDACQNVSISGSRLIGASSSVYLDDTLGVRVNDCTLRPNANNITFIGTTDDVMITNCLSTKYSNVSSWANSTPYTANEFVKVGYSIYICIADHTSATATDRPGDGSAWTTRWIYFSRAGNAPRKLTNSGSVTNYIETNILRAF